MIKDKIKDNLIAFGKFFVLFCAFALIPSCIYSIFVKVKLPGDDIVLQTIANVIFMLVLIGILFKMFKKDMVGFKNNFSDYLGLGLKYWGIGIAVMIFSNLIINTLILPGISQNEELNRAYLLSYPILGFISAVVVAPVVEELTFRFGLKGISKNVWLYCVISGVIFGLMHAITLITSPLELLYIIPYGALGFSFAYIYYKTNNIVVPILLHMLHNFVSFVLIMLVL